MSEIDMPVDASPQPDGGVPQRPARLMDDKVVRWLLVAVFAIIIFWLGVIASALVLGVLQPAAPRTFAERELSLLDSATKKTPKDGQLWARQIDVLIQAKQYAKAEQLVPVALKSAKTNRALVMLADAKLSDARKDQAAALKKATAAQKEAEKEVAAVLDDYKQRGVSLSNPKVDSPALQGAYMLQAEVYSSQKKWEDVIKAYSSFLNLQPNAADVMVLRGDAYRESGNNSAARKDYKAALKFIPDYKPALDGLKKIGG